MVLLTGCGSGPSNDIPAVAVAKTHASVASLALAVHPRPNERSTSADTQVLLQTGRDAIADAQRELTAADDADDSDGLLLLQSSIVPLRRSVGWLEPERPD